MKSAKIFFLSWMLFLAMLPVIAAAPITKPSTSTISGLDTVWQSWMKAYPDGSEYNWVPLKLLFNDWAKFREPQGALQNIKNTYPNSKLIPYVDYELARSTQGLAEVAKKYPSEVFPKVTAEFLSAWGHLPAPGVRIAALAQMEIASRYYSLDAPSDQKMDFEQGIREWRKVLTYYPNPSGKDTSINNDEWNMIVLVAEFTLLEAYTRQGDIATASRIAEEILACPDRMYGYNYGKQSHAEVYLWKAEHLANEKNYAEAEKYLELVARDYTHVYWGYHGGIGDIYYKTSVKSLRMLPPIESAKILANYSTDQFFQSHLSDWNLAWTGLMRAGLLLEAGNEAKAKEILKATYLLYPVETRDLIKDHSPQNGLDNYFTYEGDTLLSKYYTDLQNTIFHQPPIADSETIKQLLPPGAKLVKADMLGVREYPPFSEIVRAYPLNHQKDCIVYADLDADGVDELAVAYSSPTVEKGYTEPQSYLNIYKYTGTAWTKQYSQPLGNVVYGFDAVKLFRGKPGKQLVISSGTGASIGYGLFLIQYQDGKYRSLLSEKDTALNWGIQVTDLDADAINEVLAYQRYWPFPTIYEWSSKDGLYEISSDTNSAILKNLYSSTIKAVKTPYDNDGKFNDRNAWKLFISYDKLGDYDSAIKVGNELLGFQRKSGGGYNWFEYVKSRLAEIESIDRMTVPGIPYDLKLGLSLDELLRSNPKATVKTAHARVKIASLPPITNSGTLIYPVTLGFLDNKLVGIMLFPAMLKRDIVAKEEFEGLQTELLRHYLELYGANPERAIVPGPHDGENSRKFRWINSNYVVTLTLLPSRTQMLKLEMVGALTIMPTSLYFLNHNWTQDEMNLVQSAFKEAQ